MAEDEIEGDVDMRNELGELVKAAKGDDRTIREYAKDSGVDHAVISKIITGKYIPKKPKVLMALTSVQAAPRNGVTYEKLAKVAQYDAFYQAGLVAGMAASNVALSAIGGLPLAALTAGVSGVALAKKKRENEQEILIDKAVNNIQRFSATAIGLIYGILAQNGILFKLEVDKSKRQLENEFDTYLSIEGPEIEEYIIGYVYLDEEERRSDIVVSNMSRRAVERFLFLKPNEKRKLSIVVNCQEVYDYLLKYKGQISYRGYLSIILLDVTNVTVVKEESLAWYYEDKETMPIPIV